tara:strand:- start:3471 stop:3719 length:249 start_codon:yes stop_codon:yes gene_type:complete
MTTTYQSNALDISYNGWENWATWNVALWIQNCEGIYSIIQECDVCCYEELLPHIATKGTPDGVDWRDPKVNVVQLNSEVFDF